LLMGTNGIAQYLTHTEFVRGMPLVDHRVSSTFRHANDFGAYLVVVIPLVFGLFISPIKRISWKKEWESGQLGASILSKVVLAVILLSLVGSLGLTLSRSAWIGFLLSLAIFACVSRKFIISIVAAGIFLSVFMPILIKVRDVSFTTDNVKLIEEYGHLPADEESLKEYHPTKRERIRTAHSGYFGGMGRRTYWADAVSIIEKYPVFGSGLNTYSLVAKRGYPHNSFLQIAAEIGIVGILAFMFMMVVLFIQSCKACFRMNDPYIRVLLAGVLAGWTGFLVQSFFDTTLFSVQLSNLMWIFIGLIVAVQSLASARNN
jgi:putative inorganic carbon (hco3(-)) transporter